MSSRHLNGAAPAQAPSRRSSRIPGFYKLPPEERVDALEANELIDAADAELYRTGCLPLHNASVMVENVFATFELPLGVGVNFSINGEDRVVPMVVEEPSVVAAVSNMARLTRAGGGFVAETDASVMIGQIQLMDVANAPECVARLQRALPELERLASAVHPRLVARGGGMRGMEVRHCVYDEPGFPREDMVVLHFYLDCVDAMGANMINTIAERLAPHIEALTGETVGLKILSNLADRRLARAHVTVPAAALETEPGNGPDVAYRIASAWRFAWADPYRAATHNKGVMNGIDAVALATGNDWRAIEAGAHAYAARDGQYRPLTTWRLQADGSLHGSIEVPMQFGTIGGPVNMHPKVAANLRLLGVSTAGDLAGIAAAVGLAQNLGALRALATEGIQAGHMRMHARSVAASAGALPEEIEAVCTELCSERNFSVHRAETILHELRTS